MRLILALVVIVMTAATARAGTLDSFNADVGKAYASYRTAASYLRTGNGGLASLELGDAADAWKKIVATYAKTPPAAFAKDPAFAGDLGKIQGMLDAGLDAVDGGDTAAALKAITPIRDMLYDLRKRNGIRLYADCITELNREMVGIWYYRHNPPNLKDAAARAKANGQAKTYLTILADCRSMAPKAMQANAEFKGLFNGTKASATSMIPAVDSQDTNRLINVLRELVSFDRIIYFKFGG